MRTLDSPCPSQLFALVAPGPRVRTSKRYVMAVKLSLSSQSLSLSSSMQGKKPSLTTALKSSPGSTVKSTRDTPIRVLAAACVSRARAMKATARRTISSEPRTKAGLLRRIRFYLTTLLSGRLRARVKTERAICHEDLLRGVSSRLQRLCTKTMNPEKERAPHNTRCGKKS